MVIEIVPKPREKVPFSRKLLFIFSIILFVGILSSSFFIKDLEEKEIKELSYLEEETSKIKGKNEIELEKKIEKYKEKINIFNYLILNHKSLSSLLKMLEENTHPYVFYKDFSFVSSQNKLILEGETENFQILYHQMEKFENFKKDKIINDISLDKISLTKKKEGKEKVNFILSLIFNEEFLTKK